MALNHDLLRRQLWTGSPWKFFAKSEPGKAEERDYFSEFVIGIEG